MSDATTINGETTT